MPIPLNPSNEAEQLGAVAAYGTLDKGSEMELDSVAEIAAQLCGAPIAWVSLVDDTHERIKGHFGFVPEGIHRGISLGAFALDGPDVVVVLNAAQDERFADHPLVVGEPRIKFYAAAPLRSPQGEVVGALAVMDLHVRELSEGQRSGLKRLSRQVMTYLEQRREIGALKLEQAQLRQRKTRLRQSDRRLVDIVTRMTEACFALDRQWRFTFVNDRCETLLRRRRGEILGRTIWDVFGKLVGTPIEQQYRRAMAERVPVSFESYSPIAERWLDVRLIPTEEGLGAFLLDIHERKILEVERQKFVSLAENSHEFIGMSDLEGIPFYVNEAARRMMGAETRAEAQFKPVSEYFFPEDQAYILNEFLPRALAEGHAETEVRFRHFKTGAAVWMIYHVFTIRDASGVVIGFATVSRDISERKRVEEALRAREEHAQSLLQLSQQLERTLTSADVLRACREAVQRTLGLNVAWFYMLSEDERSMRLTVADDGLSGRVHPRAGEVLMIAGDAMLEEIVSANHLVLVEDARTDPRTNKDIVAKMQNRTIMNMPIVLAGKRIGAVGTGTYGDEGVRHFSAAEREFFAALASRAAAALDRVFAFEKRQSAEDRLRESAKFTNDVLDSLTANIAVLDAQGTIVRVNAAWERFARENAPSPEETRPFVGLNYFAACLEAPQVTDAELALKSAEGIRSVLSGESRTFTLEYPCHSPSREAWFVMHVSRLSGAQAGAVVAHEDITERKQAEQAVRTSEERVQTVIKHMTDGLVMARLDGQLVHWNPAALEMHGFMSDKEWCRGVAEFESVFEIRTLDGQLVPFTEWPMPRLMRGEILRGLDLRLRRIGGDWERVFRYSGAIVREPSGERLIFLTMADITAHRLAEESLESSRRFLSEVIENSGSLIFVKDREGRYQLVNRKWEETTGRSRTDVLGATDADVFAEDDARRFRAVDLSIMETGQSQTVEESLSEGERVRSFLSVKFPLKDAAGHISGVCGMTAEITERKEAEEKLREQATLLDKAQDAILVRTLEHEVKYWNKSAERLYGWTAEEAVGRSVEGLLYNDATAFLAANEITLTKGEWIGEIEQFTKDGRALVVEGRWTLVRDEQGNPKSVLAINTDLTERKKLEEQFLRAQRMESIGTLAGGIAHDLNNVLGPILMSLELLKMRFPDRESQQLISIISASGERGAAMVKQVLSFARGVTGERLEVQVRHLVNDIARIINETFLKHVEIRTIIPHDLWTVIGDATQLHQVLLNLCVNARDAMPNGGVLTISAENVMLDAQYAGLNAEAAPGPYVSLQVEDSGTGIPSEILEKIFDPFFTTKETGKGTGLGLATTLAIVKSHGGFIRVYSEVGRGTRFKTYLPATESTGNSEAVRAAELPRGKGECILIVDDEASVRQITQQTLEAFGYRVIVACDGAEALSIYAPRQAEIAAVVTDMMMPIMDGPALIQVLQRMNPKMPILAASGLVAEGQVARAARLGIKHFLPKPYTAETLLKNLKQALAGGAD
jgi:PAS domain S-box-containing protein